jgi:hypothetical protein
VFKTSFNLDEDTQESLRSALNSTLEINAATFSHEHAMGCGIQLVWDDYTLEWSLDNYLGQMERGLQHELEEIGATRREHNQDQGQSNKNLLSAPQETSA